jgi:hypothetical protein
MMSRIQMTIVAVIFLVVVSFLLLDYTASEDGKAGAAFLPWGGEAASIEQFCLEHLGDKPATTEMRCCEYCVQQCEDKGETYTGSLPVQGGCSCRCG